MIIKFESLINNQGKKNKIEFSAAVQISKYNEFNVYEFSEPSQKEMNRIEISNKKINIMSGISTINLSLNEKLDILYDLKGAGNIKITTLLHDIQNKKNNISFNYSLFNANDKIGHYKIKLTIK